MSAGFLPKQASLLCRSYRKGAGDEAKGDHQQGTFVEEVHWERRLPILTNGKDAETTNVAIS